ncbi:putative RNA-directed DNA polymerase, eukaryota, reverse transcriptase zinc-binding domain protein [Tanacetum coccineum]
MLSVLGFGNKWRSWIQSCLQSSRSSVLVNGSPTSEFLIKRGLREGDPLSPFLFIIVMEGLHVALQDAIDLVMDNIICVLHVFCLTSSLKLNIVKSNVYGVGVSSEEI